MRKKIKRILDFENSSKISVEILSQKNYLKYIIKRPIFISLNIFKTEI